MENNYLPRTVEEVFRDYRGRHAALHKALTRDVQEFFKQCDPEKENLCLYGHPNEEWEVNLPAEEVPPELPEPALGINFARDGMNERDWLCLVAVHSDAWLLAVSSFYGAKFDKHERKRLFNLICELPTVFEVVIGRQPVKERTSINNGGSKMKSIGKGKPSKQAVPPPRDEESLEEEEEEDEENVETYCGICGAVYTQDEFWIACDICERWFHGKCVKITPARAEHIKQYKCPSCNSNKRARP